MGELSEENFVTVVLSSSYTTRGIPYLMEPYVHLLKGLYDTTYEDRKKAYQQKDNEFFQKFDSTTNKTLQKKLLNGKPEAPKFARRTFDRLYEGVPTNFSRREVRKSLRKLQKDGFVDRSGDEYELTIIGDMLISGLRAFRNAIGTVKSSPEKYKLFYEAYKPVMGMITEEALRVLP